MIKRATIITFLCLFLITSGMIFEIFYSSHEMKTIKPMLTKDTLIPKYEKIARNQQIRSGVSKDLWIAEKGDTRLHHHIASPHSILTATPHNNRIEIVEKMMGMECYFQEKLEKKGGESIQNIRYLQAEEGTYCYIDHYFNAHSVFLALYRMPGETLTTHLDTKEAYLKGIAEKVSLSFSDGSPDFRAEKLKAHMHPQRNIKGSMGSFY